VAGQQKTVWTKYTKKAFYESTVTQT